MPLGTLLQFSRLVAGVGEPAEILPLLAGAALDRVGADASAVLRVVEEGRLQLAASRNLDAALTGWSTEAETIGPELADRLRAATGFPGVYALPLVWSGDLYGIFVLLFRNERSPEPAELELAAALADLAAIALGKAAQYAELQRSYAELKTSREALARAEKLRALGQMAAGVSHDLLNILNPLGIQLALLRRRAERGEPVSDLVERIEEAVRHGVSVVEGLRAFSRQEPERSAEVADLEAIARAALELARPRLAAVEVREELVRAGPVQVRTSELVTAVLNLLVNAGDALPQGGHVTLRTGTQAEVAFLEVEDDGPGMPPEVEQRVFEPFFTTRKDGTGLGLAMVYALTQRSGGSVSLATAPGRGARFRLAFRRAPAPAGSGPEAE